MLMVVEGHGSTDIEWGRWAQVNHNRASHYLIFPTLLELMGYGKVDLRAAYGPSLTEKSEDSMTFNRLYNARLGRRPEWRKVEPNMLPSPPNEDYIQ